MLARAAATQAATRARQGPLRVAAARHCGRRWCSSDLKKAQEEVAREYEQDVKKARRRATGSFWKSLKSNPERLRTVILNIFMATMVLGLSVQVSANQVRPRRRTRLFPRRAAPQRQWVTRNAGRAQTLARQTENRREEEERRARRVVERIASPSWLRRALGHALGVDGKSITDAQLEAFQREVRFVEERAGEVEEMLFEFEAASRKHTEEEGEDAEL